jgi:hypothetical protein
MVPPPKSGMPRVDAPSESFGVTNDIGRSPRSGICRCHLSSWGLLQCCRIRHLHLSRICRLFSHNVSGLSSTRQRRSVARR